AAPRAAYTCAMDSNPRKGPIAEGLTLAPIAGASPARRLPRLHGKLPFRLRPLSRLGGDALPHAGQRFESANIRLAIARLPLLDHPLELRHERGAEHVENLMSRVAGLEQSLGGGPRLRRIVVQELLRHDLVERDVEMGINVLAGDPSNFVATLERVGELGVLG